jgi:hypothetical protein
MHVAWKAQAMEAVMETRTGIQLTLDEHPWSPPANPFVGVISSPGTESGPDDLAIWYPFLLAAVLLSPLALVGTWIWLLAR